LRPRSPAHPGRARRGRGLLLRGDRRHRRRRPAGRALPRPRDGDHGVDGDALANAHGAPHLGATQPREADAVPRRAVRLEPMPAGTRNERVVAELDYRYGSILDGPAEAVTIQTEDGKVVYANQAAAELMELGPAEDATSAAPGELVARYDNRDAEGRP